jgi:hypothetical protein
VENILKAGLPWTLALPENIKEGIKSKDFHGKTR